MFMLQQSSDRFGWLVIDQFDDRSKAEKASQELADYSGKRCRVVELVPRSVQRPRPKTRR